MVWSEFTLDSISPSSSWIDLQTHCTWSTIPLPRRIQCQCDYRNNCTILLAEFLYSIVTFQFLGLDHQLLIQLHQHSSGLFPDTCPRLSPEWTQHCVYQRWWGIWNQTKGYNWLIVALDGNRKEDFLGGVINSLQEFNDSLESIVT